MKKILLVFVVILLSTDVFSQCIALDKLFDLCQVSLEQKDEILNKLGFQLSKADKIFIDMFGPEWYNKNTDNFINIKTTNDKFQLKYRLKGNMECYNKLRNEVIDNNFTKDFEKYNEYNALYFYYSNDKYGIILSKWKAPEGYSGDFFSVEILDKKQYQIEMNN